MNPSTSLSSVSSKGAFFKVASSSCRRIPEFEGTMVTPGNSSSLLLLRTTLFPTPPIPPPPLLLLIPPPPPGWGEPCKDEWPSPFLPWPLPPFGGEFGKGGLGAIIPPPMLAPKRLVLLLLLCGRGTYFQKSFRKTNAMVVRITTGITEFEVVAFFCFARNESDSSMFHVTFNPPSSKRRRRHSGALRRFR